MKYQENNWFLAIAAILIAANIIVEIVDNRIIFAVVDIVLGGPLLYALIQAKRKKKA